MNNRFGSIPIRYALLVPFFILMIIFTGTISYITFSNGRKAVHEVTDRLQQEIAINIRGHLAGFLKTPHSLIQSAAETLGRGLIKSDNPDALIGYFQSRVKDYPSISSIYFGNTRGGLVNSGREGPPMSS